MSWMAHCFGQSNLSGSIHSWALPTGEAHGPRPEFNEPSARLGTAARLGPEAFCSTALAPQPTKLPPGCGGSNSTNLRRRGSLGSGGALASAGKGEAIPSRWHVPSQSEGIGWRRSFTSHCSEGPRNQRHLTASGALDGSSPRKPPRAGDAFSLLRRGCESSWWSQTRRWAQQTLATHRPRRRYRE
jgi:hypothetical protein